MASGEAYQLLSTNPSLDNSYRDSEDDYDGTSYLPTQPSRSRFTPRLLLRAAAAFTLFVLLSTLAALLLPISPLYLYPAASPTGRVERNPRISLSAYLHSQFNETDVVAWTFATETYVLAVRNWDARREEVGLPDMVVTLCLDEECLDEVERTGGRAYGGYLRKNVRLPRPTRRRRGLEERGELVKRGEERGHYMAWCKFKGAFRAREGWERADKEAQRCSRSTRLGSTRSSSRETPSSPRIPFDTCGLSMILAGTWCVFSSA